VARASLLIATLFAIDKPLDLLRQVVVGRQFGVGAELDAFHAANNLPDLMRALITGGALALALIPVLADVRERHGRPALWLLFSRVANLAFTVTAVLTVAVALAAETLVAAPWGIAPGFPAERQQLVADLMRLNLVALLLFSVSGLLTSGLQANQHFFLPALAPVVYDLGQIFGALVLAPTSGLVVAGLRLPAFGLGVHGLVDGVIVGAALHLLVQLPGLARFGFRWSPAFGWRDPRLRQVLTLMLPRLLTIGAFQAMFLVQDNLASRLPAGAVTALTYGWLIMQFPETLIATALGTALLPTLSELFARRDAAAFADSVARALRLLLALALPAAVLLAVTVEPLVSSLFAFGEAGSALVAAATRGFLIGLVGHAWLEVLARAWFARLQASPPLAGRAVGFITFLGLGAALVAPLGVFGLALANSIAFTGEALILLLLLRRHYPGIVRLGRTGGRVLAGSVAAVAAAVLTSWLVPGGGLLDAAAAAAAGALVCLPFLIPELRLLASL